MIGYDCAYLEAGHAMIDMNGDMGDTTPGIG